MTFTMERGVLVAFDSGAFVATVRLAASLAGTLEGVPVSRGIDSGEMTAGRTVAVAFFDAGHPTSAMVVGVH